VKHETLFNNQDVSAAGEIQITRGVVVDYNNSSGTYTFTEDDQFKRALLESWVKVKPRLIKRLK
jgi:hypothetical protein